MKYKEFLEKVPAYVGISKTGDMLVLKGYIYPEPTRRYSYSTRKEKVDKKDYPTEALYFSCYKGGISGGSCWDEGDSDPHYYSSSNEKISYESLDNLLEELCPDISFLQYRKIQALMTDVDIWTECEYYGNTSDYEFQTLPLKPLYELLVELGYLK